MTLRQRYWFSVRKLELAFALQVFERLRAVTMGLALMEMCPLSSAAHVERSQVSASQALNDSCISFPNFQVSDNPAQTGRQYIPWGYFGLRKPCEVSSNTHNFSTAYGRGTLGLR